MNQRPSDRFGNSLNSSKFNPKKKASRANRGAMRQRLRQRVVRAIEQLEARHLLAASTLYLDFDALTGGQVPPGNSPASFDAIYAANAWAATNANARSFLDFGQAINGRPAIVGDVNADGRWDGDGTLDLVDATLAKRKILQTVQNIFKGFDVDIQTTNAGWNVLQSSSTDNSQHSYVLFVGNEYLQSGVVRTLGRAYQAPVGENNEWFGFVYAGNIARAMSAQALQSNKSPQDYIWNVSATIAHEFGHLLGLGNPGVLNASNMFVAARQGANADVSDPFTSLMASGGKARGSNFPNVDYASLPNSFSSVDLNVETYVRNSTGAAPRVLANGQNQYQELLNSFSTDTTQYRARGVPTGYSGELIDELTAVLQAFTPATFSVPTATQGTKGTQTQSAIAAVLSSGFNSFVSTYVDDIAALLNLPTNSLPLVGSSLTDTFGLTTRLQSLLPALNTSSVTSLASLQSLLVNQGFTVDFVMSNAAFAALPANAAADFIRARRTYSLLDLAGQLGARAGGLSGVQYLESLGFSGNMDALARVGFSLGFGVDTAGFYIMPGVMLRGQIEAAGSVQAGTLNSTTPLSVAGSAGLNLTAQTRFTTTNPDGRIRLSDLANNFNASTSTALGGRFGFDAAFATMIAGQNLNFDGNWAWDLSGTGATLDAASGVNTRSFQETLTETIAKGIQKLQENSPSLSSSLSSVPWFGNGIASNLASGLSQLLTVDTNATSPLAELQARGFTVEFPASPESILSAAISGTPLPSDLLRISLNKSISPAIAASAAGAANIAGMNLTLAGSINGAATANVNLALGYDINSGIYLVEGGQIGASLNASGNVTATATVPGLTNVTASLQGQLSNTQASVTLSDGDATPNERFALLTPEGLAQALTSLTSWSGSLDFPTIQVTATIPSMVGVSLPPFKVNVSASYNMVTGVGSFSSLEDAMLDGLGQWVFAGLSNLKTDAANLTALVDDIPLVGESLAPAIRSNLQSGFDFAAPLTNLRDYITQRGFVVSNVISAQDLFSGNVAAASILELTYSRHIEPGPFPLVTNGSLEFGDSLITLGGSINVTPALDFTGTFGMDLLNGPYVREGASVQLHAPMVGNLVGTASTGNLLLLNASASANLDPNARAIFSDFDAIPSERYYLIATSTQDPLIIENILQSPQTRVLTGTFNLNLQLVADNPADKIPVIGSSLPPQFTWNAVAAYDLAAGTGSYTVTQDASFQQAVSLLANTEQTLIDGVLDKLDQYNPLPQALRDLLTSPLPVINESPARIVGLPTSADIILNPKAFKGQSAAQLRSGAPESNHVQVQVDATGNNSALKILSGQGTELVTFDVLQTFNVDKSIPVVTAPLFSLFGILNFDAAVNVIAALGLTLDMTFGVDTDGFFIRAASGPDDFAVKLTGTIGGQIVGTGRLVIVPLAEVSTTLSLVATGGVILQSFDDDKLRTEELTNPDNINVGLAVDINLKVDGEIGFPDIGLGSSFNIVDRSFPIYRANGSAADMSSALSGVGDRLESEAKELAFKASLGPIAIWVDVGVAVINKIGAAIGRSEILKTITTETIQDGLKDLSNQGQTILKDAASTVSEVANRAGQEARKTRDKILRSLGDAGSIFGGGSVEYRVIPPNRKTYSTSVSGGTISITANQNHTYQAPREAQYVVGMTGDGKLFVDGPDFTMTETIGYTKSGCWDGCEKNYFDGQYTHFNRTTFSLSGISTISIAGTDLNDQIIVDEKVLKIVRINGLGGDDLLAGGSGNDVLLGGGGNDRLLGGKGNDDLRGEDGADVIFGGLGRDQIRGGAGDDQMDESQDTDLLGNVMYGDDGNDVLRGTAGSDTLYGGLGNDSLYGLLGNDILFGDDGDDYLEGFGGNDNLQGGLGNDSLVGDDGAGNLSGNDTLSGGDGSDVLSGGQGSDTMYGGNGADKLLGGSGDDLIYGGQVTESTLDDADEINGGEGDDGLYGGYGNDQLSGGPGSDELFGGTGDDDMDGGIGFNTMDGDSGNDTINGLSGDDTITGGPGNDLLLGKRLYGGDGDDKLIGTSGDDYFESGDGTNEMSGLAGNDALNGGTGNDRMAGGEGDDLMSGWFGDDTFVLNTSAPIGFDDVSDADGTDTLDFSGSTEPVVVRLGSNTRQTVNPNLIMQLGGTFENVLGGTKDDLLTGNSANNFFDGGPGNDLYQFNASSALGADRINDASGIDTIDFTGTGLNVTMNLSLVTAQVVNSNLRLTLLDGNSIENLVGGSRNDLLIGNALANTLTGAAGNDDLQGQAGDDTYGFNTSFAIGTDKITDTAGVDTLDFRRSTRGVTIDLGRSTEQVVNTSLKLVLSNGTSIENALGGTSDDIFIANSLNNLFDGGAGNDVYRIDANAPSGSDRITDSSGVDQIDLSSTTSAVNLNLGTAATQSINANLSLTLASILAIENAQGGAGNDLLIGNSLANMLVGNGGNDTLRGLTNDDSYVFDTDVPLGTDRVEDSAGIDQLDFRTSSNDVLVDLSTTTTKVVNANLSLTLASTTIENVYGGSGNDRFIGNSLNNLFSGMAGNDTYILRTTASRGTDRVEDSAGVDTLDFSGSTLGVTIDLRTTSPQIVNNNLTLALASDNSIENAIGGDGNDFFTPNALNNTFQGNAGNDTYTYDADLVHGTDTIGDTLGVDLITFASSDQAVRLDLGTTATQSVAPNLNLILQSANAIENAIGGAGNDRFTANQLNNVLTGGPGDDTYVFNTTAANGSDQIVDVSGIDTIDFELSTNNVALDLSWPGPQTINSNLMLTLGGAAVIENAFGGAGSDNLIGNSLNNRLWGRAGNDVLTGNAGNDALDGDAGDDRYVFLTNSPLGEDTVTDSQAVDTLDFEGSTLPILIDLGAINQQTVNANLKLTLASGNAIENALGGLADDNLVGNALANRLVGNAGNDSLRSLAGSDVLIDGAGDDTLNGGTGSDTYRFAAAVGTEADSVEENQTNFESFAGSTPIDVLDLSQLPSTVGAVVDLNTNNAVFVTHTGRTVRAIGNGTRVDIEKVLGGAGSDKMTATQAWWDPITLEGNAGSDNFVLRWNVGGELLTVKGGAGTDSAQLLGDNLADYSFVDVENFDVSQLRQGAVSTLDGAGLASATNTANMTIKRPSGDIATLAGPWSISRQIGTPGDIDTFDFYLATPTRLLLDARSDASNIEWLLTGPQGVVENWRSFRSGDAVIGMLMPGKYTLSVSGNGDATGSYDFRLLDIDNSATSISLDQTVTTSLAADDQTKLFKFSGTTGSLVYMDLISYGPTNNGSFAANWVLLDPFLNQVELSRVDQDLGRVELPFSGNYILMLEGAANGDIPQQVSFVVRTLTDDTTALGLATPVIGSIALPGQQDSYNFTLTAMSRLWLDSMSDSLSISWELRGPQGRVVSQSFGYGDTQLPIIPAGNYSLVVSSVGDSVGGYTFALHNLANAPTLALNSSVGLTLNPASQSRVFRFSGVAGNAILLDMVTAGSASPAVGTILDPFGDVLPLSSFGRATLPYSGTYNLIVEGPSNVTGTRSVALTLRTITNTTTSLTLNSTITGSIGKVGEKDVYTFRLDSPTRLQVESVPFNDLAWTLSGPTGEIGSGIFSAFYGATQVLPVGDYTFTVDPVSNVTGQYQFLLRDVAVAPNDPATVPGTLIQLAQSISGSVTNSVPSRTYKFTLLQSTTLWLDVRSPNSQLSWTLYDMDGQSVLKNGRLYEGDKYLGRLLPGTYNFKVSDVGVTDSFAFALLNVDAATPITLDTLTSVSLNPANQTKLYSFAATAQSSFYLQSTDYSPVATEPYSVNWRLLDPAGRELGSAVVDTALGRVVVPVTGTYTLVIDGSVSSAGSASVKFKVATVIDDVVNLTLNSEITGSIAVPGQQDRYRFNLTAPTRLWFDSRTDTTSLKWKLTAADSSVITERLFSYGDFDLPILPAGQYALTVSGDREVTEDYAFSLLNFANAAALTLGTATNVSVPSGNQTKLYRFSGTTGTSVYVGQTNLVGDGVTFGKLYDPFGNAIASRILNNDLGRITLPFTGNYTLAIEGSYGSAIGVTIKVNIYTDDDSVLTLNEPVLGNISAPGQQDNYRFNLTTPTRLWFDSRTDSYDFTWTLSSESGYEILERAFNQDDANLGFLKPGNYTLTVSGRNAKTGNYEFALLNLEAGTPLQAGTPLDVVLNPSSQARVFNFSGQADRVVYINQSNVVSSSAIYSDVYLYDPIGNLLSTTNLNKDLGRIVLPVDGVYTIVVNVSVSLGTASSFSLSFINVADEVAGLALDTSIVGSIASIGQQDVYRFTLPQNSRLLFDSRVNRGDLRWTLSGPSGQLRTANFDDDDSLLGFLEAGDYTLTISGDVEATGNYEFALLNLANASPLTIGNATTPLGPTVTASLTPTLATRLYRFTATAGDVMTFDLISVTGSQSVNWTLISPSGEPVFTSLLVDYANVRLLQTGAYTLAISLPTYGTATGAINFSFRVNYISRQTVTPLAGTAVALATQVASALTGGTSRNYLFTLDTDNRVWLDVRSPSFSISWQLSDSSGLLQSGQPFGFGDANLGFLKAGVYQLRLTADATSNFSFALMPFTVRDPLTLDSEVTAAFSPANSARLYSFAADAGSQIFVDLTSTPGARQHEWTLFDPFGNQVANATIERESFRTTLPFAGTYTLILSGSVDSTGNDSVRFVVRSVDKSTSPLVSNFGQDTTALSNGVAVPITSTVQFLDSDSENFDGGILQVAVTANGVAADRLTIANQGTAAAWRINTVITNTATNAGFVTITVADGAGFKPILLGEFLGGVGGTALTVRLNANATAERVQFLARAIRFSSTSTDVATSLKTIELQVTDGDGAPIARANKRIRVNAS